MPMPAVISGLGRASTSLFFVHAGSDVAYFPPYLAARGLDAAEIAWVLALPQIARIVRARGLGRARRPHRRAARASSCFRCAGYRALLRALPFADELRRDRVADRNYRASFPRPRCRWSKRSRSARSPASPGATARSGCGARSASSPRCSPAAPGSTSRSVAALPCAMLGFALATLVGAVSLPSGARAPCRRARAVPLDARGDARCSPRLLHGRRARHALRLLHAASASARATAARSIGLLWTLGVRRRDRRVRLPAALFRRFALSTILIASFGCARGALSLPSAGWRDVLWLVAARAAPARRDFRLIPRRGGRGGAARISPARASARPDAVLEHRLWRGRRGRRAARRLGLGSWRARARLSLSALPRTGGSSFCLSLETRRAVSCQQKSGSRELR